MPYIDPSWTDAQKSLVMADEALMCVVEAYNRMVVLMKTRPEGRDFVKTMRFSAAHAAGVRDLYIRPVVPKEIWEIVDEDAREKAEELKNLYPDADEQRMDRNLNGCDLEMNPCQK